MKIQCTHCGTEYEMEEALAEEACGRVACGSCRKVFLLAEEEPRSVVEAEPGEEEMDQLLAEMEETLAGLEKLDLEKPARRAPLPASLETDVPPEMDDLRTAEVPPELLLEPLPESRRGPSPAALFAALLLVVGLIAQIAWLERDRWLDQPGLRALVEHWCPYLGCTLPPTTTPAAFTVVDGQMEAAAPRQYRLKLLLRNDTNRQQPLPALQVSLTDDQQRLVARRTFESPVYTSESEAPPPALAAGAALEVELLLAVPSDRVSGYEVELIPAGA